MEEFGEDSREYDEDGNENGHLEVLGQFGQVEKRHLQKNTICRILSYYV